MTTRAGRGVVAVDGVHELVDMSAVRARYRRPGPHLTVVMPVARPGEPDDDLHVRWRATMAALRRDGADDTLVELADRCVRTLDHRGLDVLISADHTDATTCWLTEGRPAPMVHVGDHPRLLPAIVELHDRLPVVGAVVDRIGADLFVVEHVDLRPAGAVHGEEEFVHRGSPGGWSQARWQRHSEHVWERNAALITARLAELAGRRGTPLVVVTGDDRATGFVAAHAQRLEDIEIHVVDAGGRHEPESPARLHAAALEVWRTRRRAAVDHDLDRLRAAVGRGDLGVEGGATVRRAVTEHRVDRLFVDVEDARADGDDPTDAVVAAAFEQGASVVPVRDAGLDDGLGALLWYPEERA